MKNSKKLVKILLLSAFVAFMLLFTACVKPPQALTEPTNVRIENGVLMWDEVEGDDEYIVYTSYNGAEVTVKTNEYDLSFIQEEGDYKVEVAAVKQEKNSKTQTKWVGTQYNYVKQNNTPGQTTAGLNFTKIEGINAYEVSMGSANLKGTVVIPESYNNLPVIKVARFAFCDEKGFLFADTETGAGCNTITQKIVLPDTIEEIGEYAFAYCLVLTDINFPIRLQKINESAFSSCIKLSNITLPISLKEIGYNVFFQCDIKEITVPDGVKTLNCFGKCKNLKQITIPESVTSIGGFNGCTSLEKIILPSKLEELEASAFSGCSLLKQIDLPKNLTTIGPFAFKNCTSLSDITFSDDIDFIGERCFENTAWYNNLPDGLVIINDKLLYGYKGNMPKDGKIVVPQNVEKIVSTATFSELNVESVILECKLDEIPEGFLFNCPILTEIEIKYPVKNIPDFMCGLCPLLTKVVLPEGVENICKAAFKETGITNLDFLPTSVKSIEESAFCYSALESANLPNNAELIGDGIFANCENLISANIYNGTYLPNSTFKDCAKLSEVTLNNGIVEIKKECFYGSGIKNIDFINEDTSIGKNAFTMSSLVEVTIPKGVTLDEELFKDCVNLKKASINGGTVIPTKTFSGCSSLTDVIMIEGIEEIGEYAFEKTGIKNIDFLPKSLKCIKNSAFQESKLASIKLNDGIRLESGTFRKCILLKSAILPSDLKDIPPELFSLCEKLSEVTLYEGVEYIGRGAFAKCALTNLDFLPSTVKTIGAFAFQNCPLEEIRYPKALQSTENIFGKKMSVKTHILPVALTQTAYYIQAENLYYEGNQDQFTSVEKSIQKGVDTLKITIYYYAESRDDINDESKNYWHYAEDGKTPVVWE